MDRKTTKYLFNVGITGIGSYVPDRIVTNEEIDLLGIGTNAEWTKIKLGIESRHIVTNENTSDLGFHAALRAITDAGINKTEIDLIILATSSPDRISPSTSCLMNDRLGLNCPVFDINAACSGFIYGMQLATNLISTKQYNNILLVASETYSKITNWENRNCIFFGDGAGAVIISGVKSGWVYTNIYSDSTGKENFTCHIGEKYQMNGKAVYNFGTKILPQTIINSLNNINLTVKDISWLIPHQPSINILIKTAEIIGLPKDKIVLNMKDYANCAGASIPMALDSLHKKGKLINGDILVMAAIGSGWTWGVTIMKYYNR